MKLTNCINCGAVLHGNKCDFCGTDYSRDNELEVDLHRNYTATIIFDNIPIKCYLANVDINLIASDCYRSCDGKLHMGNKQIKRKFEFIEI